MHAAAQFHLGTSTHPNQDDVNEVILKLLHIPDEIQGFSHRRHRKIVLVGYGIRSDLLILRRRGIIFEEIGTIVTKLDITYIVREVLGMNFQLRGLLTTLDCPSSKVHNAGNDANFTLRALLLLAYYGLRPSVSSPSVIRHLTCFKALGQSLFPTQHQEMKCCVR